MMGGVSRELPACLMVMIMMDSKSGPVLVIAVDIAGREVTVNLYDHNRPCTVQGIRRSEREVVVMM